MNNEMRLVVILSTLSLGGSLHLLSGPKSSEIFSVDLTQVDPSHALLSEVERKEGEEEGLADPLRPDDFRCEMQ